MKDRSSGRGPRTSVPRAGPLLDEGVLVLRVARDELAPPLLVRDDELEPSDRRINGDEQDRRVVVLL